MPLEHAPKEQVSTGSAGVASASSSPFKWRIGQFIVNCVPLYESLEDRGMTQETQQITTSGFSRTFGRVLHFAEMRGNCETDLLARGLEISDFAHALTPSGGKFSLMRPLTETLTKDSLIWLESYDDVVAWASTELRAQRSAEWFSTVSTFFGKHGITMGISQVMVEDTLAPTPALLDSPASMGVSVQWISFRAPLPNNLVRLPALAQELQELLSGLDKDSTKVRFFGMPTSAGGDRTLGHLWIEHADRKLLTEALFYMADAKEMLPWWKAFYSGIELIEQRRLLVKVG